MPVILALSFSANTSRIRWLLVADPSPCVSFLPLMEPEEEAPAPQQSCSPNTHTHRSQWVAFSSPARLPLGLLPCQARHVTVAAHCLSARPVLCRPVSPNCLKTPHNEPRTLVMFVLAPPSENPNDYLSRAHATHTATRWRGPNKKSYNDTVANKSLQCPARIWSLLPGKRGAADHTVHRNSSVKPFIHTPSPHVSMTLFRVNTACWHRCFLCYRSYLSSPIISITVSVFLFTSQS